MNSGFVELDYPPTQGVLLQITPRDQLIAEMLHAVGWHTPDAELQ